MSSKTSKKPTPVPFDPEQGAAIVSAVENGRTVDEACAELGISRDVVKAWEHRGQWRSMLPEGEWSRAIKRALGRSAFRKARKTYDNDANPMGQQHRGIVDERVKAIAKMMAQGQWYGSRSTQAIADELGIGIDRAKELVTAAGRLVRFSTDDQEQIDQLRTTHLARLEKIGQEAEADGKHRDAISAIRVQGELAGTIRQGNMTNMQILTLVMESSEFREWLERDLAPHLCADCVRKLYRATGGDVVDADE